jgi:LysR family transcriptional regulator, benzoate and cis,cis-muconate-responsive activator of ben and cat genes
MQLHHVRYFVTIAETGTVSAAANALHVTQPALSRQLRVLELELGVELFDRTGGRLTLSRAGRELLPWARRMLDAAHSLAAEAQFLRQGRVERLSIAAPLVTLTDIVSPFVASLTPDDPVIDVVVADGTTVAQMLDDGADLAIGTKAPPQPFAHLPLLPLPVWAYVPPDDPWASRDRVALAELVTRRIIVLPTAFSAREALDNALTVHGLALDKPLEADNGSVAQAMAAAGRGVALVSDDPRYGLTPISVDIDGESLSVRLVVGWRQQGAAASELERIALQLATWVQQNYGPPAAS